ncbi:hypothetical protein BH11PLA2_BH11PLA2_21500 [soil metagenome]
MSIATIDAPATPGFRHDAIYRRVAKYLRNFVDEHSLGHVLTHDTFVSYIRLSEYNVPYGSEEVTPELVAEVRSPTDRWTTVLKKVVKHLNLGVSAVLVFDPKTTSVIVYRLDDSPATFNAADTLVIPDVLPGFAVPVDQLFE